MKKYTIQQTGINSLSQREIEVMELIKKDHTPGEMARMMSVSKKTIDMHHSNIKNKLELKTVTALVNYIRYCQLDLEERFA